MRTISELIAPFVRKVAMGNVEVYNEFSLQHELGIFLRDSLPGEFVQFERNVRYFFSSKSNFTKREIDITVFSKNRSQLNYAIELKFPRNGQHPEQMFSFCKDIAFAEELLKAGFSRSGLVIFADDHLFYEGSGEGIYGYFRGHSPVRGSIQKPTGRRDEEVMIHGSYSVIWKPIAGSLKFAVVEMFS